MSKFIVLFLIGSSFAVYAQDFENLKNINGTRLFIAAKGKGENLVVLHGGPGLNHDYFKPYLDDLSKKYRLIYYDQRACGKSATPSSDSISISFLVNDLEAIRKEFKIAKLNLLAHSWGSVLATHYAIAFPQHVGKIIYSNPAMLSHEYDQDAAALIKKKVTAEDSIQRQQIMARGTTDVDMVDKLFRLDFKTSAYDRNKMNDLHLDLPANFMAANRALFTGLMKDPAMNLNLYDSLSDLHFPVLIIHGKADVIPISSINRLKAGLPQAEVYTFQKSGHFPFVEEPQAYRDLVDAFMKKK